jgi:hypothetical protein
MNCTPSSGVAEQIFPACRIMANSFQFSLRWMFGAVAFVALATRLAMLIFSGPFVVNARNEFSLLALFAGLGALLGCTWRRPILGAFCGLVCGILVSGILPAPVWE